MIIHLSKSVDFLLWEPFTGVTLPSKSNHRSRGCPIRAVHRPQFHRSGAGHPTEKGAVRPPRQ
eukprot:4024975-Amphidinium_carterae.2